MIKVSFAILLASLADNSVSLSPSVSISSTLTDIV
jgi:hypothetical protein